MSEENKANLDESLKGYKEKINPLVKGTLTWDRERARVLFDFDYTIECYLPQAKRRYGYFLLPILHEGQLVGRLDAKAHRKEGIFEVRALPAFLVKGKSHYVGVPAVTGTQVKPPCARLPHLYPQSGSRC